MKKVFAVVLALALMMVGTVAFAAGANQELNASSAVSVGASYAATKVTKITVAWDNSPAFTFSWNGSTWTGTNTADIAFTASNAGSQAQTVSIAKPTSDAEWISGDVKSGDAVATTNVDVALNASNISIGTFTVTAALDKVTATTAGSDATANLSFQVTIADKA